MGGCRCIFRDCNVSTLRFPRMHFFRFPVKDKERFMKWVIMADTYYIVDLNVTAQRNRAICLRHFKDNCFMNYKKDRLVLDAVPTLQPLGPAIALDYANLDADGEPTVFNLQKQKENQAKHLIRPPHFPCPMAFTTVEIANGQKLMNITKQGYNVKDAMKLLQKYNIEQSMEIVPNVRKRKHENKNAKNCINNVNVNIVNVLNDDEQFEVVELVDKDDEEVQEETVPDKKFKILNVCAGRQQQKVTGNKELQHKNNIIEDIQIIIHDDNVVDDDDDADDDDDDDDDVDADVDVKNEPEIVENENTEMTDDANNEQQLLAVLNNEKLEAAEDEQTQELDVEVEQEMELLQHQTIIINSTQLVEMNEKYEKMKAECERLKKFENEANKHKELNKNLVEHANKLVDKQKKLIVQNEKLKKENEILKKKCNELEKEQKAMQQLLQQKNQKCKDMLLQQQQQQQQQQQEQQPTSTVNTNNKTKSPAPATTTTTTTTATATVATEATKTLTKSTATPTRTAEPTKKQIFKGIKKYLSASMFCLLRMEMFGHAERTWKADERQISKELLILGEHVYNYFIDEFRLRLPALRQTRKWLNETRDNKKIKDE